MTGTQVVAQVSEPPVLESGFTLPFAGTPELVYLAPTQATTQDEINMAIGQEVADFIAEQIGLDKEKVLTEEQYILFITGQGRGGDPELATLADESVRIFTNTTGYPLYSKVKGRITPSVLASYGLFVTPDGWLESLANEDAPTRQANILLEPGGYIDMWFRRNGARESLEQLKSSAYRMEAFWVQSLSRSRARHSSSPTTKRAVRRTLGCRWYPLSG